MQTNILFSWEGAYSPAIFPQQKERTLLVFSISWLSALTDQVRFDCGCRDPCPTLLSFLAVV